MSCFSKACVVAVVVSASATGCRLFLDPDEFNEQPDAHPLGCNDGVWETYHVDFCDEDVPDAAVTLPTGMLSIDTSLPEPTLIDEALQEFTSEIHIVNMAQKHDGPEVTLLLVDRLTIPSGAILRGISTDTAQGRPLVIAARTELIIEGTIDVSSDVADATSGMVDGTIGAGADPELCGASRGRDGMSDLGGGGGGGGGMGHVGGAGGRVQTESTQATGGMALERPAALHGGCPGGDGSTFQDQATFARHGSGGGAVFIWSNGTISIDASGLIDAGGQGGQGGRAEATAGGGGGGSGGYIGFQTGEFELAGTMVANGAGGGGGKEAVAPMAGDGEDGSREPKMSAGGSSSPNVGDANGGDGGFGMGEEQRGLPSMTTVSGAGGGGGAAGYILRVSGTSFRQVDNWVASPEIEELTD